MRRLLAVALLAAAVPATSAHAIPPPCDTTGRVLTELGCDGDPWDRVPPVNLDDIAVGVGTVKCDAVRGALPGTTTPAREYGSASCDWYGTVANTYLSAYGFSAPGIFWYESDGPATLASSTGYFSFDAPYLGLRISGTYVRSGGAWTFVGYQRWTPDHGDDPTLGSPYAGTGTGLPVTQGFPLVFAGA